jgi:histidinol-phosphate aminotransferase
MSEFPDLDRRHFLRFASAAAAAAPIITEAHLAFAAEQKTLTAAEETARVHGRVREVPPPDAVLIGSNENPLGPCKAALEHIAAISPRAGRYLFDQQAALTKLFAEQNGLPVDNVAVYAGSSEPLHYSILSFTSPTKSLVTGDLSYEAPWQAAPFSGTKLHKVPLIPEVWAHDVKAMVATAKATNAGVLYICNPNNPTGTLTSHEDIGWMLDNKPKGAIVVIDEAYIHLSEAKSAIDYVAQGKDIIVLRTFSKAYGMAGLRCGIAAGRADLLDKLVAYYHNPMPVTSSAAAYASLMEPDLVPTRRKITADTRKDVVGWLKANGFKVFGDSQSNCFLVETGRPGSAVQAAMRAKKVYIGRSWAEQPTAVRISVGTPEEMAKFKVAWKDVMAMPATAFNETNVTPLAPHTFYT